MYLNEYQHIAKTFAIYPGSEDKEIAVYPFLGLAEEAGEVCGKLAKSYRGDRELDIEEVAKELGDVMWQLSECARQIGWTLDEIAYLNIDKLTDRRDRDAIKGSGDTR